MSGETVVPKVESKPGFKTTEFWITVAVSVFGLLLASGVVGLPENGFWNQVFGTAMTTFTAGVYTLARAAVKNVTANISANGAATLGQLLAKRLADKAEKSE